MIFILQTDSNIRTDKISSSFGCTFDTKSGIIDLTIYIAQICTLASLVGTTKYTYSG